jgi:uncharacterized protein (TIGR02246 family)
MPADHSSDEAGIRKLEAEYDAAWNRGDSKALVSSFAPDAIVVNPYGLVAVGRVEFEEAVTEFLRGPAAGSIHTSQVTRFHFPKDDVAVVDGDATVSGLKDADGASAPPVVVKFTDVMIKKDGRWSIVDVRAYVFLPRVPRDQSDTNPP